ncbi:MAG: YceI family protein [Sphingobium sp.]
MRASLIALAVAAALTTGAAIHAQNTPGMPGQHDAKLVTGGSYAVDPNHTQVLFAFNHMGFTQNIGIIASPASGTLTLDPKALDKAKVEITFPVTNIRSGVSAFDEHLMKDEFFDAAKFPTASFTSTSVKVDAEDREAEITGNLTIKGITKQVTLDADFVGAGTNPMSKKETVGFSAEAVIKRSDFGLGAYAPAIGDAIELKIAAAFEK